MTEQEKKLLTEKHKELTDISHRLHESWVKQEHEAIRMGDVIAELLKVQGMISVFLAASDTEPANATQREE